MVYIRREPWSSLHATVLTRNARTTADVAALIWSIVESIAVFLGCCAPSVRARFQLARERLTSGGTPGGRITQLQCVPWQKVILCGALAASSRSIRIPSVTGSIEPD